ncbi:unnamed protein product [Brassicogethes aeneus]|uniref:Receptor ligand binding region domain-containing protein n=1 Tax=Brassicogethes aeneus TaxID=1431903 RepID=A0A9P0AY02_BRAAE|nr:unnamed protein product [Brassicogethes aeneus]
MYARVVILSVRGPLVRKFMIAAHGLDMTKGDYTFLDVEIFPGSYWGDHDWETGDEQDATARKAYEALLRVSLLQPANDDFQIFAEKVKERSLRDYNYSISDGEENIHYYCCNQLQRRKVVFLFKKDKKLFAFHDDRGSPQQLSNFEN